MKYTPKRRYCGKCGGENPIDSRFCKSCGFFIGETGEETPKKSRESLDLTPPIAIEAPSEIKKKPLSSICARCGQDIEGLERCGVCGLYAPQSEDEPDDFIGDFMVGVPVMLSNPEKFAEMLPYKRGLHSLVQPILWATLFFIIFWVVIYISGASGVLKIAGTRMSVPSFLLISVTLLVFVVPWIIVAYTLALHGASLLVGGRGIIERTSKTLCILLSSLFLYTATLMALYYIADDMMKKHHLFISSSPWRDQYLAIPLVLKILLFIGQFYMLIIQIRILARVHYTEPWRIVAAHVIVIIPVAILYLLNSYGYV